MRDGRPTWIVDNIVGPNRGDLYCVDTWEGGVEHDKSQMGAAVQRFDQNVRMAVGQFPGLKVKKVKARSRDALAALLVSAAMPAPSTSSTSMGATKPRMS